MPVLFQIYWLKNRVEIRPERDPNYLQAADGHLIVITAGEDDRANFTCVAENVANRRLSPAARLQVVGKQREFLRSTNARNIDFFVGTTIAFPGS